MKLKVETIGNPAFPRYGIVCENGVWFDGQGWTADLKKAMRFASLKLVKDEWLKLQTEMETRLLVLSGTVQVAIQGVNQLSREQLKALQWFLASASTLTLDYTKERPRGLERAIISSQIHWDTLRRRTK